MKTNVIHQVINALAHENKFCRHPVTCGPARGKAEGRKGNADTSLGWPFPRLAVAAWCLQNFLPQQGPSRFSPPCPQALEALYPQKLSSSEWPLNLHQRSIHKKNWTAYSLFTWCLLSVTNKTPFIQEPETVWQQNLWNLFSVSPHQSKSCKNTKGLPIVVCCGFGCALKFDSGWGKAPRARNRSLKLRRKWSP